MRRLLCRPGPARLPRTPGALEAGLEFTALGPGGHAFALIPLRVPRLAPAPLLHAALRACDPGLTVQEFVCDPEVMSFRSGSARVLLVLSRTVLPEAELAGTSRGGRTASAALPALRDHAAHFMVMAHASSGDALDQALLLTHTVAALLQTHEALGVVWGAGEAVTLTDDFLALASLASRTRPPLWLWVTCDVQETPTGGRRATTHGLHRFGVVELEIASHHLPATRLIAHLLACATSLLREHTLGPGRLACSSSSDFTRARLAPPE